MNSILLLLIIQEYRIIFLEYFLDLPLSTYSCIVIHQKDNELKRMHCEDMSVFYLCLFFFWWSNHIDQQGFLLTCNIFPFTLFRYVERKKQVNDFDWKDYSLNRFFVILFQYTYTKKRIHQWINIKTKCKLIVYWDG